MFKAARTVGIITGALAAVGFAATLSIHASCFFSYRHQLLFQLALAFHLLAFLLFLPILPVMSRLKKAIPTGQVLLKILPKWVLVVAVALGIYASIGFIYFMMTSQGGNADVVNGKYVLQDHGRVIRTLTEAEYIKSRVSLARMMSGHLLPGYFAITIIYLFLWPKYVAPLQLGDDR